MHMIVSYFFSALISQLLQWLGAHCVSPWPALSWVGLSAHSGRFFHYSREAPIRLLL